MEMKLTVSQIIRSQETKMKLTLSGVSGLRRIGEANCGMGGIGVSGVKLEDGAKTRKATFHSKCKDDGSNSHHSSRQ